MFNMIMNILFSCSSLTSSSFLRPVWFDSHPRGSLHGSPEHRPAAAAERSLARRQQHRECCGNKPIRERERDTVLQFSYFRIRMRVLTLLTHMLPCVAAWRNSAAHGSQSRPGGGGQMSAEERRDRGRQGTGETAVIFRDTSQSSSLFRTS